MAEYIEIKTTIDAEQAAHKIAETLVSKRLAACVQIWGPITSTYWWQGKMEQAQEWLCTAKTRKSLYQAVELAIKEVHTYDEPEIIATDIIEGSEGYLSWINKETIQR